ncbi:hypothetical protein MAPG_05279 [Magnaporthiopsis poae ATCC 64411]|uniref:Protein kinase domain-containing protein n=1 Tax=Magnaporthiopsis poae (strain ATCC 64411 / 73-15) TaxID=644358 RepID=A0A0C4DYZ4_MAGP6|nr:hypothetical protein MAPG_05279 [Magnaporthiopsis poae ATCC 64411]
MASAEIVLAALGGADLCLKYGAVLIQAYRSFRSANKDTKERILTIEAIWSRTALQIGFLRNVVSTLGEEHLRIQADLFEILCSKLKLAISKTESVLRKKGGDVNPWKYVVVRKSLDATIASLERWQRIFDPSWFLIMRVADGAIDSELSKSAQAPAVTAATSTQAPSSDSALVAAQKFRVSISGKTDHIHISLPANGLDWGTVKEVAYSTTKLVKRAGSSPKTFAVDSIPLPPGTDARRIRADAEALAKKLHHIQPGYGILQCQGLIKHRGAETKRLDFIDMVFNIPPGLENPASLRKHLITGTMPTSCSLSAVLGVARQLAEAVSFLHTCDFVHKNIRPETILILGAKTDRHSGKWVDEPLGSAFLVGFDSFRGVTSHTTRTGDDDWHRDLYRHPSRQGPRAQEDYVMQHDVYSLGVCLLELGIGRSFIEYANWDPAEGIEEVRPGEALDLPDKGDGLDNSTEMLKRVGLGGTGFGDPDLQRRLELKDHLVRLARTKLLARMGDLYAAVVVTCLTCLDSNNEDFGDEEEMRDEDGILIGVRFIEKVLLCLNSILV